MTTIKLNDKARDAIKSLLEDHQTVTDALAVIGKPSVSRVLSLFNDKDNSNIDVPLNYNFTKRILGEQKGWIEGELAKHGLTFGK